MSFLGLSFVFGLCAEFRVSVLGGLSRSSVAYAVPGGAVWWGRFFSASPSVRVGVLPPSEVLCQSCLS